MGETHPYNFCNVNNVGAGSRVKLVGITHPWNKPAPILRGYQYQDYPQVETGAGFGELISCIKIWGETRPYNFCNVNNVGAVSRVKLVGITQIKINPPPGVNTTGRGAGDR